ncbi:hypothetical protein ANANG_G00106930 [Anguilla anguilla]|uniref:Uncharacterized protein n=1 Tax=Anguilla anguilla TaxID=7936 RepID=A0A9D3RZ50_ANGAN|nr:hypothetical protein ANANG_G00106930 [Anguilla anguilla]
MLIFLTLSLNTVIFSVTGNEGELFLPQRKKGNGPNYVFYSPLDIVWCIWWLYTTLQEYVLTVVEFRLWVLKSK